MDRIAMPLWTPFYVIPPEPDHAACWALKETTFLSIGDKAFRRERFESCHYVTTLPVQLSFQLASQHRK